MKVADRLPSIAPDGDTGRHEATPELPASVGPAWLGGPNLVPDLVGELPLAGLSPEATVAAIYEAVASLRLALVYCPGLDGDVRKGFASRLGDVNLTAASAPSEIELLRRDLELYESHWSDELHHEIAQIRHGLWRLRELCVRHQGFLTTSAT